MDNHADWLLKNGTVVLPQGTKKADILIRDGKIQDIGSFSDSAAKETLDCSNLHILPGIIDTQVHFREPGAEHKETLETGMMAAAAGGVTSVFEMPNTNPLTTSPEALQQKLDIAAKNPWTNYAFYFGGTAENAKNLPDWENLAGVCGIKIFMGSSTGNLLVATDKEVDAVLSNGCRVVAVHSEDEMMMIENKKTILGDSTDPAMHPVWRSVESCLSSTKRLIRLAKKTGRRVHVLHVTSAEEMEFLAQHKDIASVEVLGNHLTLHAPECYEKLGTHAQQNPAIRDKGHQDALWRAIDNGLVDILASDHAPHTLEEKAQTYPQSPSGTPGVQTLVPIMLNHVNNGKLTLERLVDLMCYGPERIHQIARKGRIARGYDADFTIVDMNMEREITNAQQKSKAGWTPFDGVMVKGWPIITVIGGQIVMREDELLQKVGKPICFRETLKAA
ncbi:MAG: dihydroorotase [Alphaproteobacteria bacterium]|nr:dihydroorotase [Alphaproteobacteria bacterium]